MKKQFILILILVVLAGCGKAAGLVQEKDQESLSKSTELYYKFLVWKYYEKAARFVDPKKAREFEDFVIRNQKDLQITDFQIRDVTYIDDNESENPDSGEGKKDLNKSVVRVAFTYFKLPSVSEKSIMIRDTWIQIGDNWYVSSDYPDGTFE